MKFSTLAFLELAFSTSSRILATVESSKAFVVFTLSVPLPFTHPLTISSPALALLGTDSPVSAAVSSMEFPSIITPSRGTFSPGLITMILPISTSSGSTCFNSPFSSILAYSGHISIISDMDWRDLPTAYP